MAPWVESFGVLMLAASGALVGAWFSRLPRPWWFLGFLTAIAMILLYALGSRIPELGALPPVSWMLAGRAKFATIGVIGAFTLTTPLPKLPRQRDRIFVGMLAVCIVLFVSVWPFLAPAFNRSYLAGLRTQIDQQGICRQSTAYTCGPASAVTALRKLGFPADEGRIAILAHTTPATGTPPDVLAYVLNEEYGKAGLKCEYRAFDDVSEMKQCGYTLAVIKFSLLLDHFVTVLEVRDDAVVIGDPLSGMETNSPAEFAARWRFEGVVLSRK